MGHRKLMMTSAIRFIDNISHFLVTAMISKLNTTLMLNEKCS